MKAHFSPDVVQDVIVLEGENHFLPWTAQDTVWTGIEALGTPSETR